MTRTVAKEHRAEVLSSSKDACFKKSIICHICKEVKGVAWKGIYMCNDLEIHQNTGCSRLLEHEAWAGAGVVRCGLER